MSAEAWIIRDDAVRSAEEANLHQLGGKAAALARLASIALDFAAELPRWIVVTPQACCASASAELQAQWASGIAGDLSQLRPTPAVTLDLAAALESLGPAPWGFAVRSSAVDEDGAAHAFAGQLDSYLGVRSDRVCARVADVWRSGFSERLRAYRRSIGLPPPLHPPAVLIQTMLAPRASGIAFAIDPQSGRRSLAVIAAVRGLGHELAAGTSDADHWWVDRDDVIREQRSASQAAAWIPDPESPTGIRQTTTPARGATEPALSADEVRRVARLVRAVSRLAGRPQDIEWAYVDQRLMLLQARPITALTQLADPDAPLLLWDNSNIVESYRGVTTPLTFSFARAVYEGAYRQFCRLLAVPQAVINRQALVFARMLGLIQGRVYYNLLNWYRLLAMLPGFHANRSFMEQMMGVREALPPDLIAEIERAGLGVRFADRLQLLRATLRIADHHRRLPATIKAFQLRLDRALAASSNSLETLRLDELVARYRALEAALLRHWDAPLINDFLAMIFFGMLRRLCQRWCGDTGDRLHNDLIAGGGDIISAEPAQRIREMAALATANHSLVDQLCDGDVPTARRALQADQALAPKFADYLERFGDRCLEELKLESSTLTDDATPLLRAIGHAALRQREGTLPQHGSSASQRRAVEQQAFAPLAWWQRWLFRWVLHHARARVRDRENLRFERTRLFGRVRRLFLEIGRRLAETNVLSRTDDVFYLTVEELLGYGEGATVNVELAPLVAARRSEFERYHTQPDPPERFMTRGTVPLSQPQPTASPPDAGEEVLQGVGCYPGRVRGIARVIRSPRDASLHSGEILVAQTTDPGWIMLFPLAAGVLVERGSLLSHSAIVARELGIPTVVAIPRLTQRVASGDLVELDGELGRARVLNHATAVPAEHA
jgi:pyruvate,water dikinase